MRERVRSASAPRADAARVQWPRQREDRVLAEFLMSAQGKGSGIELSRHDAVVCRLRAGKIVETGYYNDQQQAREVLGLQKPP